VDIDQHQNGFHWEKKSMDNIANSLRVIQNELIPWQTHNFPGREAWQPIMGLAEEFGEYFGSKNDEEKNDALADIVIFALDACNAMGYDVREFISDDYDYPIPLSIGWINHHFLKREQGIRQTENHYYEIRIWLFRLIATCVKSLGGTEIISKTWNEVKCRDWRP